MPERRPELSIVVPVCDEADNVEPLVGELERNLEGIDVPFEIIFVDDGSRDATWRRIGELARSRSHLAGLRLSRNFGHQHALLAGLSHASGRAVVSMDGDLQHPPRVVPELYAFWREGFKIVNTRRIDDESASRFKRWTSRMFYRLFSTLAGLDLGAGSSDFRLIDRQVVDALLSMGDADLFLRGIISWVGFPARTVEYRAERRRSGATKYTLSRMLRFAASAVISFSTKPLRMGIWVGVIAGLMAFVEIGVALTAYLRGHTVPGWTSQLIISSFMFGILCFLLGILGAYLGSIHAALQRRPRFLVREALRVRTNTPRGAGRDDD